MSYFASLLWSIASQTARTACRIGIFKTTKLGPRVISVGNIQAGGAGKTPLVARIAQEAIQRKLTVCILSRGYQSLWEEKGGVLVPGMAPIQASECGDEPALLHELVPQAYIGIGADRVESFRRVRERVMEKSQSPVDLVILDDGFQNRRIQKDLEIIALTSLKWGSGTGVFRDFPRALKFADLIVWTKGKNRPESYGKPFIQIKYRLPPASPAHFKSTTPVWLVTGIAHGQFAFALAKESGYSVMKHFSYEDHAHYSRNDVEGILKKAQAEGAQVALTGKDWVKWKELGIPRSEVIVLEPELDFVEGYEVWSKILWGESF